MIASGGKPPSSNPSAPTAPCGSSFPGTTGGGNGTGPRRDPPSINSGGPGLGGGPNPTAGAGLGLGGGGRLDAARRCPGLRSGRGPGGRGRGRRRCRSHLRKLRNRRGNLNRV